MEGEKGGRKVSLLVVAGVFVFIKVRSGGGVLGLGFVAELLGLVAVDER